MSEETCKTVRVKSPITEENSSGFIVINEADKTAEQELFDEVKTETVPSWKPA